MMVAPMTVDLSEVAPFTMLAVIHIHSLWRNKQQEQLLHLQIQDVKLTPNSADSTSKPLFLSDMESGAKHFKEPFLVHVHSGKIKGVFDASSENTISLNFKKGIAMLLQIQAQYGLVLEDDVTGQCQVAYQTTGTDIIKVKHYENCEKKMADGIIFANQVLRVSSGGRSETVFTMDNSHIKTVISEELRSLVLEEHPAVGIHISSSQFMQLLSTHSGPSEAQGALQDVLSSLRAGYVNHTVHAKAAVRQTDKNSYSVQKILNHLKAEGLNTQSMTVTTFLQLSEFLKHQELATVKNLLKQSQAEFVPILIDAAAAASTPASLEAVVSFLNITNPKTSWLLKKFLYACALSSQPSAHLINIITVKKHARDIFTERKKAFSAPVRLDAAQLLLMYDPLESDVREIILKIAEEKPEFSKFLTIRIQSMLRSDSPARNVIRNVLKDPKLNNYFHLARLGCSSSYSGLMAENQNVVAAYDFDFLFSEAGVLKQSNSHFYAQIRERRLQLLQVSLETSGLDSLFGNEATKEAEEEELMAGMSAMFLGVQIQPVVFFQGYGDLMSKYFSAGEGPMNIISGNLLVLDHRQSLILQSGLEAQGFFHGGLSVDVSADLEFSLFSQESKSSVNNKFSLVISAMAEVDAVLMSTMAKTVVKMDPSVRFVTTVSFYDTPVQYCLQLIREPLIYR
ncbi:Microsomal triglyceride transfer protein [Bagarius yarrelli]|uniref:Microsomal triglyceride transfer protein n=1 Tax=Bagarius yarrelli TaxID=175774 RepID=A0A556TN13_BAGYA|nr:Microsomal triglyceride transfer protein [Bagarius yarrelli]